jgi:hypothetical protein
MVIRRVDPVSCAKLMGVCYAMMGLLIGAFFSLLFVGLGSAMGSVEGMQASGPMGALFGAGAIVAMPIMYGIMGFVGGAVGALVYNAVAGWIGGVRIDVDPPEVRAGG